MDNKEQMEQIEPTEQVLRQPYEQSLEFAIKAALGNLFLWFILSSMLPYAINFGSSAQRQVADGILRGFLAILAMRTLSKIIGANGFKFSFTTKGFKKGMIAHIPLVLSILTLPVFILSLPDATLDVRSAIPSLAPRAIFDVGNAVWEEVLWRGVLMTGLLIKWGTSWNERATVRKRVAFMLICSFAFGLIHFNGGILHVLFAAVTGTVFSAAYIYSRNLLACSVVHIAVNYVVNFTLNMFYDIEPAMLFIHRFMSVHIIIGVAIFIPITIYLTIKAEPFSLEDIP